jgi:HAE1 family hydrophobic/amphiphilic exporter-1
MRTSLILLIGAVGILTACKITQPVAPPAKLSLPQKFDTPVSDSTSSIAGIRWHNYFEDSSLKVLIGLALENNQDNLMTLERIKTSRAIMQAAKAGLLPRISGIAGVSSTKFGDYTMNGVGNFDLNLSENVPEDKRLPEPYSDFLVGLSFDWEVDVWGKLKNQKKAAIVRYLASEEMSKAVQTWLISDVASHYFELLALDKEIQVLHENIRLQELGVQLISELKEGGKANQLGVDQFEALALNSKSQLQEKIRDQQSTTYALQRLIGMVEIPLERSELDQALASSKYREIGLPAQLLQYRPDLREAELALEASRFDVMAAKAAFYPSLNLFGMAGFNAFDFSRLFFSPASIATQLGAGLAAPIFNRRQIQSQFDVAKADQRIALLEYEKRTLNAYLEVLDLVNQIHTLENQLRFKDQEVAVLQRAIDNSNTLFSVGYANYLEVINAQSRALQSSIELADLKASQLQAQVQLYRALGGGWN